MNKSAIKQFAVTARVKLLDAITQKAYELGIRKEKVIKPEVYEEAFRINDKFFKKYQIKQREKLLHKIEESGFDQTIEEVAYTWFNRFIAIRFMEVNDYLPTGLRVLSSKDSNKVEPDIVTEVLSVVDDLELNVEMVYPLQDENNMEELFKYILIKQCNKLGEIMPLMFERIEDYTELLLPDHLLSEGSVVRDLVSMITEDDWKEQVEIIGWLYQYYISEKKDQVFSDLKRNIKISKENIPAATQLFTPKWIVQYMVENSLGRLWLESHPNDELQKEWKFYLEETDQGQVTWEKVGELINQELSPEDIKILDPSMGSGHILVYAFDLLYEIYKSVGYSERDIPQLILEKNLYGLDIDDRAVQLAYFSLMMKARSYNRRIFRKKLSLNVCSIQESNGISDEAIEYLAGDTSNLVDVHYLCTIFKDAKDFGSILKVDSIDLEAIEQQLTNIRHDEAVDMFTYEYRETLLEKIPPLLKQAKLLKNRYDIVITNPPYMGNKGMNENLKKYIFTNYPLVKMDLFAVFMERCLQFTRKYGFTSMITQQSWMFLSFFEPLRKKILNTCSISSMLHLGSKAFEDIGGEVVQSTAFTLRYNESTLHTRGTYIRLVDFKNSVEKQKNYHNLEQYYYTDSISFQDIPGNIIAYWATEAIRESFRNNKKLEAFGKPRQGVKTLDNDRFLKLWHEVDFNKIGFHTDSIESAITSGQKWFPYNKGGSFRKWYGNNEYVVNWENDGQDMKEFAVYKYNSITRTITNIPFFFKEGLTWSTISSGSLSLRYFPTGFIFDSKGSCMYFENDNIQMYILGFMNSKVADTFLKILSPTLDFNVGPISNIPIKIERVDEVNSIVERNIELAKWDWDQYELSWEFQMHPFIENKKNDLLEETFYHWKEWKDELFLELKRNEEKLNNLFRSIYELDQEVSGKVNDQEVSIRKANRLTDIKSFISYSVGCLFGRYSLDQKGIAFAGGELEENNYPSFKMDQDNIIPITDDEYFEDDIVSKFIHFIRATFGEVNLEKNLNFIADVLKKKPIETSRQRIRRYFLKEFYKDHVQLYQKRPIYWMFDSGKQDGFKALMYIHRYDEGTVARVRTDYLHLLQRKYESEITRLDLQLEADLSAQDKTKAKKQKEKIQKQLLECQQYDQVIAHVANQKIEMDLDSGVKLNYAMFQQIEIVQGAGRKPITANLLAKI